ncbi:MAG: isoprenylcysteine carboxylmethyltransferase family protein [Hyphomicrobium sp.]
MNRDPALRPTNVPWPPLLLAGAVGLAMVLGLVLPLAWPGINDTPARFIGIGLGGLGVAILTWAAVTLQRHNTTILPHKGADALVTDGPFRYRRNPIYLADVLILLGVAEMTKNIWFAVLALAFAVLVTWLAIIPEEQHLEERFGDAYRAYKAKTRRWI